MRASRLIKYLETLDPATEVVIPKRDYIESLRELSPSEIWIRKEEDNNRWFDATHEDRERDIPGVIL